MSIFGDAIGAIKQVILMQSRMDSLDKRLTGMASDVEGLMEVLANVRDRISRVEGVIEGAGMAAIQRRLEDQA